MIFLKKRNLFSAFSAFSAVKKLFQNRL